MIKTKAELQGELFKAASSGNIPQIKHLIEQGADVNAKDKYGSTAIEKKKSNQFFYFLNT